MPPLARRNLFHDKIRLAVTVTGIVFAVVLIVVELGLFVGFTSTTSSLVDHSGADLWVTSEHVPYVELGVPFSERKLYQVRAVPGVEEAQKIIIRWTEWKSYYRGRNL
jgi:putative ABC transport system permease protein